MTAEPNHRDLARALAPELVREMLPVLRRDLERQPPGGEREIGELSAKMEGIERWVSTMSLEVAAMRGTIDRARGAWALLLLLGTAAGAAGALIGRWIWR